MTQEHQQTDKKILEINKDSKTLYQDAFKRLKNVFYEEYAKININANMTAQEKINEANKYGRIDKLIELITDDLLATNKTALKNINNELNGIYQLNYNGFINKFKNDGLDLEKINKTETKEELKENVNPYNEIAIDTATDRANIKRSVSNTLLNSILAVATGGLAFKGLQAVYEKNLKESATITETQATRVEGKAVYDALLEADYKAKENNMRLIKIWRTQEDDKVRDAHARAEGQEAEINEPFYVDGERLMYPGDFTGSPKNIINCRCWMEYKFIRK